MHKTTNLPGPTVINAWRHSFKILRNLLPSIIGIALAILLVNERSVYYSGLRAEGFRLPYADMMLLTAAFLFPILTALLIWLPRFSRVIFLIRARIGWLRWIVILLFSGAVSWLFIYSDYSLRFNGFFTRLYVYLIAGLCVCLIAMKSQDFAFDWLPSLAGLLVFGSVFLLMYAGHDVVDYPFRLSWSEGNRFYDYSVLFGRDLYDYPTDKPLTAFIDKGRQFLWGLPFLLGRVSIKFMRFWNEFLFTIPNFILGWVFLRKRDTAPAVPFLFGLWAMLFFNNGPIYTPLILVCLMVVLTRRSPLWLAVPVVFAAGFIAHGSRFTWMFAPAIWAAMLAFLDPYLPIKTRWIRSITLGVSGILGGYVLYYDLRSLLEGDAIGASSNTFTLSGTSDMVSSQTLLWDRLFPTDTFALGVLPALAYLTVPVMILILYSIFTRRWQLDVLQKIFLAISSTAFLVVGIIISVKIGGGSNLHNLDMFLVFVFLAAGLMLEESGKDWLLHPQTTRHWQRLLFLAAVLYPATLNIFSAEKMVLPDQALIEDCLHTTQALVEENKAKGEILFLDQRQLLTFGYIQGVPLVSDYEKKLLMENALINNQSYFKQLYQDLASQRFSLIISEPLIKLMQDENEQFAHENNAWVSNISIPVLCYYRPLKTYPEFGLQILVPRDISNTLLCPGR